MIKQEKNSGQTYRYAMIFIYGEHASQVLEFEATHQQASRNEALENYFVLENQTIYLKTGSEHLSIQGLTAIRMEEKKAVLSSLFALPEAPTIVQLAAIPEKEEHTEQAQPVFEITQLKALRSESELTQKELSELTGINRRQLSRFERNQAQATSEEIATLQQVFDDLLIKKSNQKQSKEPLPEIKVSESSYSPGKEGNRTETAFLPREPKEAIREEQEEPVESAQDRTTAVVFDAQQGALKRTKEKKAKIPKGKRSIAKGWRIALWTGICLLGASGVFAYWQAASARLLSVQTQASVVTIQDQLENPEEVKDVSLALDSYATAFLTTYLTVDNTASQERETALKNYFSDTTNLPSSNNYNRQLLQSQLYASEETKTGYVVTYLVRYTIEPTELSRSGTAASELLTQEEQLESQTFEQLITLRIVEQEGLFALEELPAFSAAPENKGLMDFIENPLAQEQTIAREDAEPIEQFLAQFFKNYAESSVADMQYLMTAPESLAGEFTYESSSNEIYATEDGAYVAKSTVVFVLADTDIRHEERMTLKLHLNEGKYFVDELTHTFAKE